MKIVYTAEPIQGAIGSSHKCVDELQDKSVEARVAREILKAIIEENLMQSGFGLVESYTIATDYKFSFPFHMPNVFELPDFFGKNPDYNLVKRELDDLFGFEHPKREHAVFVKKLEVDLKTATDEQILEMVQKYNRSPVSDPFLHARAVEELRELWKPSDEIRERYEKPERDEERLSMEYALHSLNDEKLQKLMRERAAIQTLLKEGKRDEAKERVKRDYSDWEKGRLYRLGKTCGDERFYSHGFWIARLVTQEGELTVDKMNSLSDRYWLWQDIRPRTLEEVLDIMGMPHQTVLL